MLVAVHQPNFFPWLGFFDKWSRCDRFLWLDDVQFEKSGHGSWVNRVRLATGGRPYWVTAALDRTFRGVRLIRDMRLDPTSDWRRKLLRGLELNYLRAEGFTEVFPRLEPLILHPAERLLEFNLQALQGLAGLLGLATEKVSLSSQYGVTSTGTQRLADLVGAVGGTAYLTGGMAASTYQDDEVLVRAGIRPVRQDFRHPVYPQRNSAEFVPGLSILDALLNLGVRRTRELLGPAT